MGLLHQMCNAFGLRDRFNIMSLSEFEGLLTQHGFEVVTVRWYGLVPRPPGRLFAEPYGRLIRLLEPRTERLPALIRHACQCFAVLARKPGLGAKNL
jgi:hypothetical protein